MRGSKSLWAAACILLVAGCGGSAPPSVPADPTAGSDLPPTRTVTPAEPDAALRSRTPAAPPAAPAQEDREQLAADERRSDESADRSAAPRRPTWDEARLAEWGIRALGGRHITLYTDLPRQAAIDQLPAVFDQAVPQWARYFQIPEERTGDWHVQACLMGDRQGFTELGMLPEDLPPFLHGYQRGQQLWVYEQPSDYYRRHLLLHEGVHGWMMEVFGAAGPPWYMEGTAELLATHDWDGVQLKLPVIPRDQPSTAYFGRIKIIQDQWQAGQGKSIDEILHYGPRAHLEVEPYAWCWAAAVFFDALPNTSAAFRKMVQHARAPAEDFNATYQRELAAARPFLLHQWQDFISRLDYGYDPRRELPVQTAAVGVGNEPLEVEIDSQQGWQSTGWQLEEGVTYRIEAEGRFQLAQEPQPWWSEPNGVTIEYYRGLPLGILVAAIVDPGSVPEGLSPLVRPDPLGTGVETRARRGGTLFLQVNDVPGRRHDNRGQVRVTIRRGEGAAGLSHGQ